MDDNIILPEPYYVGYWEKINEYTFIKRRVKQSNKEEETDN